VFCDVCKTGTVMAPLIRVLDFSCFSKLRYATSRFRFSARSLQETEVMFQYNYEGIVGNSTFRFLKVNILLFNNNTSSYDNNNFRSLYYVIIVSPIMCYVFPFSLWIYCINYYHFSIMWVKPIILSFQFILTI